MRDFADQALTFGEQVRTELQGARRLLPQITLPVETLAAVYERMGWAHQRAGEPAQALDNFRTAATLWQDAENLTRDETGLDEEKLARVLDRRLRAQLESGDPELCRTALAELKSVSAPAALLTKPVWLYNRACLYAQASKADAGAGYQQCALLWLGRALMQYGDSRMWDYAEHYDAELEPIRSVLGPFLDCLRRLISSAPTQLKQENAEALLTQAINHVSGQG